jgi:hypothetical protein
MPYVDYEIIYSPMRKNIERIYSGIEPALFAMNRIIYEPRYLWDNRKLILDKILRR